jgi:branched-chain amino acid transport system permease protein
MTSSNRYLRAVETPLLLVLLVTVVALIGQLSGSPVIARVVVQALVSMVLVVGLSIFTSNSGVMSFGHLAFMAIGAYTCAYLTIPVALKRVLFPSMPSELKWLIEIQSGFVLAILVSGAVAALSAALMSPPLMRLGGLQASIGTIALLVIVQTILSQWTDVTRGASSLIGVPATTTVFGAAVVVAISIVLAWGYSRSRFGLMLKASREDEAAAVSLGVRVGFQRSISWCLSGFVAGIAGALYSHFISTFDPTSFYLNATFTAIMMLVVGGLINLSGAVVGVTLISVVQEMLRRLQDGSIGGLTLPAGSDAVVMAMILLFFLIKRPGGLIWNEELQFRSLTGAGSWFRHGSRGRADRTE